MKADGVNPPTSVELTAVGEVFELRLYITGRNPMCERARHNLRKVCEEYLPGRYRVDVVDLTENPRLAADDGVVAVPTVVRKSPGPIRKVVGDLSDTRSLLTGLGLVPQPDPGVSLIEPVPAGNMAEARWVPVLYINGSSSSAAAAAAAVRKLCDAELPRDMGLRVVDIQDQPTLTLQPRDVSTAALPDPIRRLVRDVVDIARVHLDISLDEPETRENSLTGRRSNGSGEWSEARDAVSGEG